ncbi:MAG: CotH kinase family protein [Saprospiraceae bacterium]|nr:CotH kinase family protein [Saprospiraceae bacterium]
MNVRFYLIVIFLVHIAANAISQYKQPTFNPIFNDEIIARIDIQINPDSLQHMFLPENLKNNHEYPADFIRSDGQIKDTVKNVGFRLRGNTSRTSAKKSFKVKFNHFDSPKYQGLSDLNLNGEHNDPSIIRSKLTWDLMKMAGIPAPRANHVALYINGEYRGLYINVEHIDNDYFNARNSNSTGQLFKCLYGSDFTYSGHDSDKYKVEVYEPSNRKSNPEYSLFLDFLQALNDTGNPDFRCNLESVFDVDTYLKTLAIEILVGHWDNPVYNKNNAYLYLNENTGKAELISYDTDNTFGIDWLGIQWQNRNIYSWAHPSQDRPVYYNLMAIPEYRIRFGYFIKKYIQDFFNPEFLNPHMDSIKNRIAPFVVNDLYAGLDYGYDYQDFLNSYETPTGGHVKTGLKEYISKRATSALSQVQNTAIVPFLDKKEFSVRPGNVDLDLSVISLTPPEITIHFSLNEQDWKQIKIEADEISFDAEKNSFETQVSIPVSQSGIFNYYITSTANGKAGRFPHCDFYSLNAVAGNGPTLFINEFMADNTKIRDESGEFDDWIEIYNGGADAIWLGDKYLTDKKDNPGKWLMPDVMLEPNAFALFWADEDKNQGVYHTNFKLSKSGEFIGVFQKLNNQFIVMDSFSFGETITDVSYGKYPDGEGTVFQLNTPTPSFSNLTSKVSQDDLLPIHIFPSPASDRIYIRSEEEIQGVSLFNINGNLIINSLCCLHDDNSYYVGNVASGLYLLKIVRKNGSTKHKIIIR